MADAAFTTGDWSARGRSFLTFWRRFRRNRGAVVGLVLVAAYVLIALLSPVLAPYDPLAGSLRQRLQPPSWAHWLGTDEVGRDVLSRIIAGAAISLQIMVVAVLIGLTIGVMIGVVAGYYGRLIDAVLMRIIDTMMAFPSIFLAIAIVAVLGPGIVNVMIATGLYSVPQFARVSRAAVLSLRQRDFVEAAKASGETNLAIIGLYILPNALPPLFVQTTLRMSTVLLAAASLSFLGLGVLPPAPEWGGMLADGRNYLLTAPHVTTFPGLAILIAVIGFNLLGDGLRDALDPKLRG